MDEEESKKIRKLSKDFGHDIKTMIRIVSQELNQSNESQPNSPTETSSPKDLLSHEDLPSQPEFSGHSNPSQGFHVTDSQENTLNKNNI